MAFGLVLYDCIYLIVAAALYGGAGYVGIETAAWLGRNLGWWAVLFAVPVALVALVVGAGVLGLLLPRVRPGRYPLMKGRVFWGWLLRTMLRRILFYPPIKVLLFTSNILRWLTLTALGGRVSFTANMSSDVDLLDPWLLRVGPGATIGARCLLSGHYIKGGDLVLDEIEVGGGTLLAADVAVGPAVRVGRDCFVLGRAALAPGVQVGDGALVGSHAFLEAGVVIEAGARVPNSAHVKRDQADDAASSASSTTSSAAPAV